MHHSVHTQPMVEAGFAKCKPYSKDLFLLTKSVICKERTTFEVKKSRKNFLTHFRHTQKGIRQLASKFYYFERVHARRWNFFLPQSDIVIFSRQRE